MRIFRLHIIRIGLLSIMVLFFGFVMWFSGANYATARNSISQAFRSEEEQRIIDIYKRTNEAVVFISTITLTIDPFDFFSRPQPREGSGSGIIVDAERGIVLTNLHVIQDAHKIQILLASGESFSAKMLGLDSEYDIAVLQIRDAPKNLSSIRFADSSEVEVGQRVLAIGNPHGLNRTLTTGIVSSIDRTVRNPNGYLMKGLVQTDAAINPGNSGGPLLDLEGRLIGVNSAIVSTSGDSAGIGFAVPSNQIKRILPELLATGRVLRPALGWVLWDTTQGPMVRRVLPGTPAEQAGVQPIEREVQNVFRQGYIRDFERADLIVAVQGKRVRTSEQVEELVGASERGKPIRFTLRTGHARGPEREVDIKPLYQ